MRAAHRQNRVIHHRVALADAHLGVQEAHIGENARLFAVLNRSKQQLLAERRRQKPVNSQPHGIHQRTHIVQKYLVGDDERNAGRQILTLHVQRHHRAFSIINGKPRRRTMNYVAAVPIKTEHVCRHVLNFVNIFLAHAPTLAANRHRGLRMLHVYIFARHADVYVLDFGASVLLRRADGIVHRLGQTVRRHPITALVPVVWHGAASNDVAPVETDVLRNHSNDLRGAKLDSCYLCSHLALSPASFTSIFSAPYPLYPYYTG